jgi:N-acetyl-gamma-glutamyl-phosphate reductase
LGHGDSKKFLSENNIAPGIRIIDLANDFRLQKDASFKLPVISKRQPATRSFSMGYPN